MIFHKFNPKTGHVAPKIDGKDLEDGVYTIDDFRWLAHDLGQDLVMIKNAKLVILHLCNLLEDKDGTT